MSDTIEHDHPLTWEQAADYAGVSIAYLKGQVKGGGGPATLRLSQRVIRFSRSDLDTWIASWRAT